MKDKRGRKPLLIGPDDNMQLTLSAYEAKVLFNILGSIANSSEPESRAVQEIWRELHRRGVMALPFKVLPLEARSHLFKFGKSK